MAVTELACLRLLPPTTATTPSLLSHLKSVKQAQESFSGHFVRYYHCLEEPSTIFMIGGWPSVQTHMKEWIPSKENQDLLQLLENAVNVKWMWHVNLSAGARQSLEGAKVIAIGRHMIKQEKKVAFESLEAGKQALEDAISGKDLAQGGWRLDRGFLADEAENEFGEGKDAEWVSFGCPKSGEDRERFTPSQGLGEYAQVRDFVEVFDVKHAVRLEV